MSLSCSTNSLTSLPALPNTVTYIYCNHNNLTSLPTLPSTLGYLECDTNQLTSIPTLPYSLQYLSCLNNNIAVLPTLDCLTPLFFVPPRFFWHYRYGQSKKMNPRKMLLWQPLTSTMPSILMRTRVISRPVRLSASRNLLRRTSVLTWVILTHGMMHLWFLLAPPIFGCLGIFPKKARFMPQHTMAILIVLSVAVRHPLTIISMGGLLTLPSLPLLFIPTIHPLSINLGRIP